MHCLIGLGCNLGDRPRTLERACDKLLSIGLVETARSHFYETAATGMAPGAASFLNGVIAVQTELEPHDLLHRLQQIEQEMGRKRGERWDSRTLDLDLLLYGDAQIKTPDLTVPHPRMGLRAFVLRGAAEVVADWIDPCTNWTIQQLWQNLLRLPRYIALTGDPGGCSQLVHAVAGADCYIYSNAGGPQSSSGSTLEAGIEFARTSCPSTNPAGAEFLHQQQRELDRAFADHAQHRVCVSDFWLGQSGELPQGDPWVQPTLLVCLESDPQSPQQLHFRAGPTLVLPAHDLLWASRELQAAVESMSSLFESSE